MGIRRQWLLMLAGCGVLACTNGVDPTPDVSSSSQWLSNAYLSVQYEVERVSGMLLATPSLTNLGADTLRGMVSPYCGIEFAVYQASDRSGSPVWPTDGVRMACPGVGQRVVLAPGDTLVLGLHTVAAVSEITGPHGPGTYYAAGRISFSEPEFRMPWTEAGEVDLR